MYSHNNKSKANKHLKSICIREDHYHNDQNDPYDANRMQEKIELNVKSTRRQREASSLESHRNTDHGEELQVQYKRNQQKIERLSTKLEQLYNHYKQQTHRLNDLTEKTKQIQEMDIQNMHLEQDIKKVKQLLHNSILQEQIGKLSFAP